MEAFNKKAKSSDGYEVTREVIEDKTAAQNVAKHTAATAVGDVNSIAPPKRFIWCGINKKNDKSNKSRPQDVIAKNNLGAEKVPPPYHIVWFAVSTKSDAEIAELKDALDNGEEAQRLAGTWTQLMR